MAATQEYRVKLGLAKSRAANNRELTKQSKSPYQRMVKKLPHKKGFVTPTEYEPSANTRV